MEYDKPLLVVLLGVLSSIPYEIFTRVLRFLGVGKFSVYELSSLMVTINRPTAPIGVIVTFIISGAISFVFYHSLKKLGLDYIIIKGIGTGLFSWIVMETMYTWLIEGPGHMFRPVSDYYLEIGGSAVFGITLGLLFKRYLLKQSTHFNRIKE